MMPDFEKSLLEHAQCAEEIIKKLSAEVLKISKFDEKIEKKSQNFEKIQLFFDQFAKNIKNANVKIKKYSPAILFLDKSD